MGVVSVWMVDWCSWEMSLFGNFGFVEIWFVISFGFGCGFFMFSLLYGMNFMTLFVYSRDFAFSVMKVFVKFHISN